jgi:hypothetical protein
MIASGMPMQASDEDWYFTVARARTYVEVDDVRFVQPVGFVWFERPRYRVKAGSRRV